MKISKVLAVITAIALLAVMSLAGCTQTADQSSSSESAAPASAETAAPASTETAAADTAAATDSAATGEKFKIGISTDAGYAARKIEVIGIYKSAEKDDNVEVVEQNADNDSAKQIQQVKALVDQGVNAIVVCAVDMNAIQTALDYAASKGVIVTLYDRFVDNENVAFTGGYDSYSDGVLCANELMKFDDGQDHIVFELVGNLSDTNALARRDGFHSVVDTYKNITVVQILTDWATDTALSGMQNALQKDPDVWGIFDASSHMDGSVLTALQEAGKAFKCGEEGHVYWVALGEEPPGPEVLKDGWKDVSCPIPFDEIGYQIYDAIMKLKNGETLDSDKYYCKTYAVHQEDISTMYDQMWPIVYADLLD